MKIVGFKIFFSPFLTSAFAALQRLMRQNCSIVIIVIVILVIIITICALR